MLANLSVKEAANLSVRQTASIPASSSANPAAKAPERVASLTVKPIVSSTLKLFALTLVSFRASHQHKTHAMEGLQLLKGLSFSHAGRDDDLLQTELPSGSRAWSLHKRL